MNRPQNQLSQLFLMLAKFLLPYAVWIFVFRDFIFGRIALNMDSATIYSVTKFYFNNLFNGVVPLWDPFVLLGTPFYAITLCNLFNPAVLWVAIGHGIGLDYYQSFLLYMVLYYFVGLVGFYCLVRTIWIKEHAAYCGYVLLMFSGIGAGMFNQLTIVELFVPAVWFFVFLMRLSKRLTLSDFWGLSFSAMLVAVAYVPFYFATLLLFVVFLFGFFYWSETIDWLKRLGHFVADHKRWVALAGIGILIALTPLVVFKMIDSTRDVVSPGRHCNFADITQCYERTLNEQGGMSYQETAQSGSFAERLNWRSLFTHLDKISYGVDHFFYLPSVVWIILVISAFVPLCRRRLLMGILAVLLLAVGLGGATGLHRWLYDHIFFFKYFRNLVFFQAYLLPLIILAAIGQLLALERWVSNNVTLFKLQVLWMVGVGAVLLGFLMVHEGVLHSSVWTVVLSIGVFVAGMVLRGHRHKIWMIGLVLVCLLEPLDVFSHYSRNAQSFQCPMPAQHVRPEFSSSRPTQEMVSDCKVFRFVHYETFYDSMAMKDARGAIGYPVNVTRGAFVLSQWIVQDILVKYTSRKLWLYDHVFSFQEDPFQIQALGSLLDQGFNAVYVVASNDYPQATWTPQDHRGTYALALEPSMIQVKHFDVNRLRIELTLPRRQFLVYTDGYTRHWKVFVDGQPQKLYRANGAFKGVWVEAGRHEVDFQYAPPGGGWIYLMVAVSVGLAFGALIVLWIKEKNWPWKVDGNDC